MLPPHGGVLIDRVIKGKEREYILEWLERRPRLNLSKDRAIEVENIATGVFSPITGFLGEKDLRSVLERGRLSNDVPWTIPIVLDVSEEESKELDGEIGLYYEGKPIAVMKITERYRYDKELFAQNVYGTTNTEHPGVARVFAMGDVLLAGPVDLIDSVPTPFSKYKLTPRETRFLFQERGWKTIVGFQTRNVPHLGHEYIQKAALTFVDGLFINPVIGKKKKGDFRDEVILSAYEVLIENYYPKNAVVLAILRMEMRYAGPREAIHHAIIRKNFGCTHFIVGRDHAGVGNFYPPFAAQEIFYDYPDLGIVPFFFKSFFYCKKCGGVVNEKICPHGDKQRVNFSGTAIRNMIQEGKTPPNYMMRTEIGRLLTGLKQIFVTKDE